MYSRKATVGAGVMHVIVENDLITIQGQVLVFKFVAYPRIFQRKTGNPL
jgi:hypothetical protein